MELISSPIGFSLMLPALSLFWRKGQQRETIILASLDPFDSMRGRPGNETIYWLYVVKNWSKYNNSYQKRTCTNFVKNMRITLEICKIDDFSMRLGFRYLEALI